MEATLEIGTPDAVDAGLLEIVENLRVGVAVAVIESGLENGSVGLDLVEEVGRGTGGTAVVGDFEDLGLEGTGL